MKPKLVFSLAGVHGSGKTTIYEILQNRCKNWIFFPDNVNPPRYPFGSKDKQTAFRAELWYLEQMIIRNEKIRMLKQGIILCDRSPLCLLSYSYALCTPEDYATIENLYKAIKWEETAIFYIEETPEQLITQIINRKEKHPPEWNETDRNYIEKVIEGYEKVFQKFKPNMISVQNNQADKTAQEIINQINNHIK
ncbi:MAG: deoxynucleoside kinase [Candidatus Jordarchaeum sp.]|uniref:deoxynucleoside kinase n=1 Tax=Candidatus Jordarchaeum sp. TaxID=2823881 RepID=UPI00404A0C67